MLTIYTWGYGRSRSLEDLWNTLRCAGSERVKRARIADVRRTRRSRNAIFCEDSKELRELHKRRHYIWLPDLGNAGRSAKWRPPCEGKYAVSSLLAAAEFGCPVGFAISPPLVIICAESDHRKCHRTEVAERVAAIIRAAGVECQVKHLP